MKTATHRILFLFLILSSLGLGPIAFAADYKVTRVDDPVPNGCQVNDCSLREAIIAANQDPQMSGNVVIPAGEYFIGIPGTNEDQGLKGDFDIYVSMTLQGAGKDKTLINGGRLDRIFHLRMQNANFKVSFSDLTLTGGYTDSANGGGIYAEGNYEVDLKNCAVLHNTAQKSGGGIYINDGSLILENTDIKGNISSFHGGGVVVADTINFGQTKITGGSFSKNSALSVGGGIWIDQGNAIIDGTTFKGNHSNLKGGAISTSKGASLTLKNSKISENSTYLQGGGLHVEGQTTIFDSEITNNEADTSGGGGLEMAGPSASVTIQDSILAGNKTENGFAPDCFATSANPLTSNGNNKFGDLKDCENIKSDSDQVGFDPNQEKSGDNTLDSSGKSSVPVNCPGENDKAETSAPAKSGGCSLALTTGNASWQSFAWFGLVLAGLCLRRLKRA